MGEMADMLIDQMWDIDEQDWLEDEEFLFITSKTCRCCGRNGLHWEQRNGKWRLHDQRGMHVCPVNPLKEPLAKEKRDKMPSVPEGEWLPLPAGYVMSEYRRSHV